MQYEGPNRRVHTVFVTRNREYHTRDGVCVAVRDLKTTAWMALHAALGMTIDAWNEDQLFQGRPLLFRADNKAVETSTVIEIMRPHRRTFEMYALVEGLRPSHQPCVS